MPVYTYKARDRSGKMVEGNLEAASQREVALSLRDRGMFVNEIKAPRSGLQMDIKMPAFLDRVGLRDVTIFSRQFATVINAGLPVVQSLNILSRQTEKQQFKNALNKVREDVETGQPLSDALGRHPRSSTGYTSTLSAPARCRATSMASSSAWQRTSKSRRRCAARSGRP